jgi:hypothetical protein
MLAALTGTSLVITSCAPSSSSNPAATPCGVGTCFHADGHDSDACQATLDNRWVYPGTLAP